MDEPLIELTPEWIEYQNLLNEAKIIGVSISSKSDLCISKLTQLIADKKIENSWNNDNLLNR